MQLETRSQLRRAVQAAPQSQVCGCFGLPFGRPAVLHNRGLLMIAFWSLSDDSRLSSSNVPSANVQQMNTWSCRGAASIGQSCLRYRDYFSSLL